MEINKMLSEYISMGCVKHAFLMGIIFPQEDKICLDGVGEGKQKILDVTVVCGSPKLNRI